jgi:hypothetical protein
MHGIPERTARPERALRDRLSGPGRHKPGPDRLGHHCRPEPPGQRLKADAAPGRQSDAAGLGVRDAKVDRAPRSEFCPAKITSITTARSLHPGRHRQGNLVGLSLHSDQIAALGQRPDRQAVPGGLST